MDGQHFDALTRTLSGAGSRRGLVGLLVALPGLRGLLALPAPDDGAAKGRHTRSVGSENHKRDGRRRRHKPHKRQHPRCKAESRAKTCAGRCGRVKNRCKKTVDCGSCVCDVCASGCPSTALQAAIDTANSGDTIRLCAGTFLGEKAIADIDKDLTIVGAGDGADPETATILDAAGTGQVLRIRSTRTVTLQGLRITGGVGGGVGNQGDLIMTGCTVHRNTNAALGPGGILSLGPLSMTDCTVSENTSSPSNVGGVRTFNADLTLTRCTIRENTGGIGGVWVQGTGILTETMITGNIRTNATAPGGLYTDSGTTTLIDSTVSDNTPPNCLSIGTGTITGPGCAP
jgi:hypothetical protein